MNVTYENIFEVHEKVLDSVYQNDYYVDILEHLLETTDVETPQDIVRFWNQFWFHLPDSGSIRRGPFFDICDIAENISNPDFYGDMYE